MTQESVYQQDNGQEKRRNVNVSKFQMKVDQFLTSKFSAVDCGRPNEIENGRVIVVNDSTLYGGAAEYHCVPQYNRIGQYLRKCMEDGKWSGDEPRCECKLIFFQILTSKLMIDHFYSNS